MSIYKQDVRVEFEDIDLAGVVNSSKYFNYLERTRIGMLTSIGFSLERMMQEESFAVVARYEMDYARPLKFGMMVIVQAYVEDLSASSGRIIYEIRSQEGALMAKAVSVMVFVDARGKPKAASVELIEKLSALNKIADEA